MANFNLPATPTTPEGALAGFYRGTQYNYGLADLDRQFRDADLANRVKELDYSEKQADVPLNASNRELGMTQNDFQKELINSGFSKSVLDEKLRGDTATTDIKKHGLDVAKAEQASEELVTFAGMMERMPDLAANGGWFQDNVNRLKGMGIKNLPEGPLTQQSRDQVKQLAQASVMSMKQIRELQALRMKGDYQLANTGLENQGRIGAAQAAHSGEPKLTGTSYEIAVKTLQAKVARGEPVTAEEVVSVAAGATKDDSALLTAQSKALAGQINIANAQEGSVEKIAAVYGMSKDDLKEYKLPNGKYDAASLGTELATRKVTSTNIVDAWQKIGSPKLPAEQFAKLAQYSPDAAMKIKKQGGININARGETPATPPASKPATPPAASKEVGGDWNAFVQANATKNNMSFKDAQAELIKRGYKPKSAPVAKAPVAVPVSTPQAGTYGNMD